VDPPERLQHRRLEGLHAEAQPVDAGLEQDRQLLVGEPFGIRLHRPLANGGEIEGGANPGEEAAERRGIERGRRAASDVDRARAEPLGPVAGDRRAQLPVERVEESLGLGMVERRGRERAVGADAPAVRKMDVETRIHGARPAPPVSGPGGAAARARKPAIGVHDQ